MIAWTKLTMFAAYDSTLRPTEGERVAALREWRARGCVRDWCFDRTGGEHEIAVVAALVIGMSVLASLQPAWRASRMDPIQALRHV